MNLLLVLLLSATGTLAQIAAIPKCAQACFAQAVNYAGCVTIDDVMDPTCACESYTLKNSFGGHDTGVSYARDLCRVKARCSSSDWSEFSEALNNLCYNKDASPKYNCGIIPGDPVPPTISVKPTGQNTITVSLNPTSTDTMTLDAYPRYTTIMTTSTLYTTKTITTTNGNGQANTMNLVAELYVAVCPTRVVVGAPIGDSTQSAFRQGTPATSSPDSNSLFAKLTAAEASASSVAATKTTAGLGPTQTGATTLTTGSSQAGNSTGTGSGAGASATKSAGAERVAGVAGLSSLGAALVGVLANFL
ncbi:uncharacterized protein BP5553_05143 [Venustampulla echinocandica]|uniref:Extracellular membrane protein CFEM domain-containing protein n=1 Tax=Venustampulla echinocandica TaxID=2656787 RepID=A0A370TQB7_9HELO|nr:uncharacterized protein BP5553_05143 [Venustampulla echinocandica]RDL37710.1 hypothetical protein BP5553_05143 [Venustampulla echinocandica]